MKTKSSLIAVTLEVCAIIICSWQVEGKLLYRKFLHIIYVLGTPASVKKIIAATLISTPTVACPDDNVTFTCTLPGIFIRWDVTHRNTMFSISLSTSNTDVTLYTFRGVLTDSSGPLTATLTSLPDATTLDGIMVECVGSGGSQEGPLTINLAGEWLIEYLECMMNAHTDPPSPPLNTRVSSTQNQLNSSTITLDWDPPSSTCGVSVSYVLTISPPPLSESPVTIIETTSAQITVSYNVVYNVTIRAVNCVAMSQENQIVDQCKQFHGHKK